MMMIDSFKGKLGEGMKCSELESPLVRFGQQSSQKRTIYSTASCWLLWVKALSLGA